MKKIIFVLTITAVLLVSAGCERGMNQEFVIDPSSPYLGKRMASDSYASEGQAALFYDLDGLNGSIEGKGSGNNLVRAERQEAPGGSGNSAPNMPMPTEERKLVKKANIYIRVENIETADASVSGLMEKYDAYSASTSAYETRNNYLIRVPAHNYELFLSEMGSLGKIQSRAETTTDVTLEYYDLEGRLATKRELLRTFQSYLGKANSINDILSVERRIAELQNEIDSTGKQLSILANRVEYATIDLVINTTSAPKRIAGPSFGEKIGRLFGGFGGFLSSLLTILIGFIIYGIPILLILGLLFFVFFGKVGLFRKLWGLVTAKKRT
jgi:hypothetical protein